jgi:hypothetical protein
MYRSQSSHYTASSFTGVSGYCKYFPPATLVTNKKIAISREDNSSGKPDEILMPQAFLLTPYSLDHKKK